SDAVQVGSTVTWNGSYPTGRIISGTVGYITFTVKVDQSYLPSDDHLIENSLVITGNLPDPTPSDNTFTETTPIADIVVEKATNGDDADAVTGPMINFGDPVTWTYQVTNTGSITLTGVQVTDRDDVGNLVVITPTVAITLSPGETMIFTYVATASATGQYTNTATVTGTATVGGVDAFGNAINSTTTVTDTDLSHYIAALADVTIVKSDSPDPVTLGEVLTYTLVYTNNGPAGASDVTITDTLPSEVTFGGMVSGSSPTQSGQSLTWNIGSLGNDLGGSLIFTVTVDSAGTGTITNSVVITTSTPDSDPSNNDDDEPTTVESPGITISKTPDLQTIETGQPVTFTISVTNTGNVTLSPVTVTDVLASSCDRTFGSLAATAVQIYACNVSNVTAGFTNTAVVSGTSPSGIVVTSTDSAEVEVVGLEVEKMVNIANAAPSQIVTYTITITNIGNVTLNPVRITDTMDTGLAYISNSASVTPSSINGQRLVWNDATAGAGLAADDTLQLTLLAKVTTITGTYNNVVVATGRYATGSTTPASDSVPVVVKDPAVEVTKGVASPGAVNNIITFTIRITNTGPSTLDQVPLFDRFVGPIEYIGGTPPANSVDNTNKVLSWDDLTQAGPNGFGQNLEPDDMFELTTVFRITTNSNTFSMVNTAEVTGAVDIFNNTARDADEAVTIDNEPTAIELLYFKGVHQGENTILNWATAVEIDNFGFRLLRSTTASRVDAVEIAFVPGQGLGTGSGATYTYTDKSVDPYQTCTYWLVDVDLNGVETDHPPLTVTPTDIDGGDNTRLYLPLILHDE
ncbi:MAG: DUF11 domain-containing protein, partial [Anaerolineae bacterium]|nr:DUF11 domain-containing protein [Anaerolineae bacterium]